MGHLALLYLFLSISIGLASLIIVIIIFIKSKNKFLGYYLSFHLSFSLFIIFTCLELYLVINNINLIYELYLYIRITGFFFQYLLAVFLTIMVHYIFDARLKKIKNFLLIIFSLFSFIYRFYLLIIKINFHFVMLNYISEMIFLMILFYDLIICIIYLNKITDKDIKKITLYATVQLAVFFPFIINDLINFLRLPEGVYFFPFIFCGNSIMITSFILKKYFKVSNIQNIQTLVESLDDNFFRKYDLSPREKDIFLLIVKGYGNKRISDELFISISTVKKHIYNIFKKINVNTRFELINFIQKNNKIEIS